jgi:Planctomycete cytochrome C/Anaphase-promoting complex subunit 4 WD40 domain
MKKHPHVNSSTSFASLHLCVRNFARATATIWFFALAALPAQAQEKRKANYQDDLTPLFRESCFGCHNADKTKGGLNLASYATMIQGGGSGAAIAPGDPEASYLYQLVTHQSEPHMPLNSPKLPDEKLAIIRRFIEEGALENSGSKAAVKKEHSELKLTGSFNQKPDGPPPMPPRMPLEPVLHTPRPGAITALAASPWAPMVAVAGQQQILLYNTESLQLIGVLPFPEGIAHVLKFSRNGKLLLAGGGHEAKSGRVVLWDITSGKRITEIGDEYDVVLAADISPDQSMVALGGPSKVVRIFSTATGELVQQIKKHTDWIYSLEFAPDNVLLASGDRNGDVFVWEAAKGQEYLTLRGHTAGVTSLSWRADGNMLASSSDDGSIRLWEMENGKQVKTWNAHGGVQCVQFLRDGKLLTCGRDHQVKLWTADGKQQGPNLSVGEMAMRAAATFDNNRVIAGDWSGEIRVWNAADGKQIGALSVNPSLLVERLQVASSGLAQQKAEHDRLAAAAAASMEQSKKIVVDLNALQVAMNSTGEAEKSLQTELSELQKSVEQLKADAAGMKTELANQQSAAESLADAIAKAQQAAEKLPGDTRLAESVAHLKTAAEGLASDLAGTQKSLDEKTHVVNQGESNLAEMQKRRQKLSAEREATRQQMQSLTAAAKLAAEKSAAADKACDELTKSLDSLQAEVQHWTDEMEFAKSAAQPPAN